MANCDIIPLTTKACSGKCKGGGGCTPESTVWVLAACEGMTALFSKQADGHLTSIEDKACGHASSVDGVREQLTSAAAHGAFSQLVLVGSANDIAWTQASLPIAVSKQVVAEIEYPLMAGWFGPTDRAKLTQALEHVFEA
jgi:hypothetical protein